VRRRPAPPDQAARHSGRRYRIAPSGHHPLTLGKPADTPWLTNSVGRGRLPFLTRAIVTWLGATYADGSIWAGVWGRPRRDFT
jgi:hypothetical protein